MDFLSGNIASHDSICYNILPCEDIFESKDAPSISLEDVARYSQLLEAATEVKIDYGDLHTSDPHKFCENTN